MFADFAKAADDRVFEHGRLFIALQFAFVSGEFQDVYTHHFRVHLLECAGLDQ